MLYADYPAGTTPVEGRTAGGRASFREATDAVSVRVVADDRQGPVAACRVLVGEQEDEILASDYAIDALGVEVKRHGEGLWRFAGEDLVRPSVAPEIW
ncbi:MAG: hypothetical protein HY744_05190 [Deltaproteobacteria bacterium]|nr:hypothetical protein [Deltaproteobacteria bacterium]